MSEPLEDNATSQRLGQLPTPALDGALRDRVLRKARGELRRPGEGTVSLRGFGLVWETALAPAVVLLAGALYTIGAVIQIASIFG